MASKLVPVYDQAMLARTGGFGYGTEPGKLDRPWGIAVCPITNNIIVTDCNNDRVQVFNERLKYSWDFGGNTLFNPMGVGVDSKGNIFIADHGNHCIRVANKSGEIVHTFGSKGSGQGEYFHPTGLAVGTDDKVYVSDWGNYRVKVVTADGKEVDTIKVKATPVYLAVAPENSGFVYVNKDDIISCTTSFDGSDVTLDGFYHGLTITPNGHVVVAVVGDETKICILDKELDEHDEFECVQNGSETQVNVEGLALTKDGHILVCNASANQIQLYHIPTCAESDSESDSESECGVVSDEEA